jgi:hypothetical protein
MKIEIQAKFKDRKTKKVILVSSIFVNEPENWDEDHQVTEFLAEVSRHAPTESTYDLEEWFRVTPTSSDAPQN